MIGICRFVQTPRDPKMSLLHTPVEAVKKHLLDLSIPVLCSPAPLLSRGHRSVSKEIHERLGGPDTLVSEQDETGFVVRHYCKKYIYLPEDRAISLSTSRQHNLSWFSHVCQEYTLT